MIEKTEVIVTEKIGENKAKNGGSRVWGLRFGIGPPLSFLGEGGEYGGKGAAGKRKCLSR